MFGVFAGVFAQRVVLLQVKNIKHDGNIPFNVIVDIARQMREKSMARDLKGTVKEILGTTQSIGASVDGIPAHDVIEQIDSGMLCGASSWFAASNVGGTCRKWTVFFVFERQGRSSE
jgi:hypothetical protein